MPPVDENRASACDVAQPADAPVTKSDLSSSEDIDMDNVRQTYFAYCYDKMSKLMAKQLGEAAMAGDIRFFGGMMMEAEGLGLMDLHCFQRVFKESSLLGPGAFSGESAIIFDQVKEKVR